MDSGQCEDDDELLSENNRKCIIDYIRHATGQVYHTRKNYLIPNIFFAVSSSRLDFVTYDIRRGTSERS